MGRLIEMGNIRILIVDDEELICRNVCSKIKRLNNPCNYITYVAGSVNEAMIKYRDIKPDVVITDICMPEGSGLILAEKIRKMDKYVILFVLSGFDDFSYVRKAFLLGVNDYLLKPLYLSELDQKLSNQLKKQQDISKKNRKTENGKSLLSIIDQYIEENMSRTISMQEAANKVNLSYHYFSKMFKENAGLSFTKYVNERKMMIAKELVTDPTIRINEIAYKLGFKESNHFSRAFKKTYGLYPTVFREKHLDDTDGWHHS